MSDNDDFVYMTLAAHIRKVYEVMIMACRVLPVPVVLPVGEVTPEQVKPSVIRLSDIAQDQPMPIEQQLMLEKVSLLFLASMDLLNTYDLTRKKYLAGAAMYCIVLAEEAILELVSWVMDQRTSED